MIATASAGCVCAVSMTRCGSGHGWYSRATTSAQLGGISRRFLQRRMAELGLRQAGEGAPDDDDG